MSKEAVTKKFVDIEESFLELKIRKIYGPEKCRAIEDVVRINDKKEYSHDGDLLTMFSDLKEKVEEKERLLKINENKKEYWGVFKKVYDWVNEDYLKTGITLGSKINFLKERFNIKGEEKQISGRSNLISIINDEK